MAQRRRTANNSALGVLCFAHSSGASAGAIAADLTRHDEAWISTTKFEGREVLRACVTSHFTREDDIDRIAAALNDVANAIVKGATNAAPQL